MRNSITIFVLICMFRSVGYCSNQNEHFQLADSLWTAEQYEWAAIEYERVVFNGVDNSTRTAAFLRKSDCYIQLGSKEKAMLTTQRIQFFGLSDSLQYEARYHAALNSFINENFEQAQTHLFQVDQFLPLEYQVKASLLHALTLNEMRKWSEAEQKVALYIEHAIEANKDSLQDANGLEYHADNHPKLKKPQRAFIFSSIIPGSGQLYSGHIFDAALSAILVLSGVGIAVYGIAIAKYYVTGIALGYSVFQRFYIAGQKRAKFLAERKNYRTQNRYNQQLEEFILAL
jgi:hypothetical protein